MDSAVRLGTSRVRHRPSELRDLSMGGGCHFRPGVDSLLREIWQWVTMCPSGFMLACRAVADPSGRRVVGPGPRRSRLAAPPLTENPRWGVQAADRRVTPMTVTGRPAGPGFLAIEAAGAGRECAPALSGRKAWFPELTTPRKRPAHARINRRTTPENRQRTNRDARWGHGHHGAALQARRVRLPRR